MTRARACGWPWTLALIGACAGYGSGRHIATAPSRAWQPRAELRSRATRTTSPFTAASAIAIDRRARLSPDDAAWIAVEHNPRLRAIRAERGHAHAELVAAGLLHNPELDTALALPVPGDAHAVGVEAGVRWDISPLFSRPERVSAARESVRAVALDIAWQEWQVAQEARLDAARVIYLARRLQTASEIEASWQRRSEATRAAAERGALTALDATFADNSLAEAKLARCELQRALAQARVDLAEAIGVEPQAEVGVDPSWTAPRGAPALETLLPRIAQRRLDLIALEHAQRSSDYALRAAIAAQYPPLEIGVGGERDVEGVTSGNVSLTFDLPFFDRNQPEIAHARAARARSEDDYDARLAQVRAQVVRLARELAIADREVGIASEAAESSNRLAALAQRAVAAGAVTSLAASELEERAFNARLHELELEQAAAELRIALATAAGIEDPR